MAKDNDNLVRDIVCGMWMKTKEAADVVEYRNDKYYFCSPICKINFCSNANYYIKNNLKIDDVKDRLN